MLLPLLLLLLLLYLWLAPRCRQIMLTTPNSLYKTGVAVGLGWSVFTAVVSLYTMFLLSALYLQRKKAMVSQRTCPLLAAVAHSLSQAANKQSLPGV